MNVFVTGIGVISGIGKGAGENLQSLKMRRDGMGKITHFETLHTVPVSEVKYSNDDLLKELRNTDCKFYSRTALLGAVAAEEALRDSKIDIKKLRTGFISSTSIGGMDRSEIFYKSFRNDPSAGNLHDIVSHDCGDSTQRIAQYLGIDEHISTISTACSSSANAIILGARMIKLGYLDAAIVGGTDALCQFTLNGFASLMILDSTHCRPFDQSRAGLNLGEGAGYIVLQSERSLSKEPYCRLSGYANANDAFHQTASSPEGDGPFLAMSQALKMSGLLTNEIDYINVHGTGTPNNDASESVAMKRLFAQGMPTFSSTKAFTGHTLGACGGIEAVYSVLALKHGAIFPNLNFQTPIEDLELIPVTEFLEGQDIRHVLSNSFGFGGNNSSLIFSAK